MDVDVVEYPYEGDFQYEYSNRQLNLWDLRDYNFTGLYIKNRLSESA